MAVVTLDQLNVLKTWERRSIPYKKYFGEMDLTEEEKKDRILMAQTLEPSFIFLFALVDSCISSNYLSEAFLLSQFKEYYRTTISSLMTIDDYVTDFIDTISAYIVHTTLSKAINAEKERKRLEAVLVANDYYMSEDRAVFMAEDEANILGNYKCWKDAKESGKTKKRWKTMEDNHVRRTHRDVNNKELPIDNAFLVGDSMLMFPGDMSLNASADELIGCRCTIEYF